MKQLIHRAATIVAKKAAIARSVHVPRHVRVREEVPADAGVGFAFEGVLAVVGVVDADADALAHACAGVAVGAGVFVADLVGGVEEAGGGVLDGWGDLGR